MKKIILISSFIISFVCLFIGNMGTKPAFAATHTHTDDCYNGALHVHTGNSTSGGGCFGGTYYHVHTGDCYGGINYHYHTGSSSSGGGCYGSPVYHSHTGNSSSGGGCYGSLIYHSHTGSSSSGGGCYGTPVYHSHSGNSTSGGGCYGQANYHSHTGNSTSGDGCYGQANYHSHTGNSTSGGGCYGQANYHSHSGSSTSGGGCYGQANYHSHVSGCYGTCGGSKYQQIINGQTKYICMGCGAVTSTSSSCTANVLKCGKSTSTIVSYSRNCGKTTSTIISYSRNCGKTISTIESYSRNCGKTTSTIESYSRNCGKTTSTIDSYMMNCGKTTSTITGYALNCNKTTSTIEGYTLSCGKSTSYIESYYMNCGLSTSTIVGYYMNCNKTAGYYYNGSTQVFPLCDTVVSSISPTNPVQTISQGGTIITTATATYLDGSTGTVSCTASGFDTNTPGVQTVTLTYSGLVGNARTSGTRTSTLSVTVKVITITAVPTTSITSIKLDVSVADAVSGLAPNPYRYTIGDEPTDWLTSNPYFCDDLTPNTSYTYTAEVMGKMGHISKTTGTAHTKVDMPSTTLNLIDIDTVLILVKDKNPEGTQYRVKVEGQYADSNGILSNTLSLIFLPYDNTLEGRKLILPDLSPNTNYTIVVSAKDKGSSEFAIGNSTAITTAPGVPSEFEVSSATSSDITLSWSIVPGAVYYELIRSTVTSDGTVTVTESLPTTINNYYSDEDVAADQRYLYKIRCKNNNDVYGSWSETPISVKTLPLPPSQVAGVAAVVDESSLDITWDSISGVIGYEVEVTYDGNLWRERVATNQISFDTDHPDCQCNIKIKAFNAYSGNDSSDASRWTNEGTSSIDYICYTEANVPILDPIGEGQYTNNSATITWNTNNNPDSVQYKLGVLKDNILEVEIPINGTSAGDGKLTCSYSGLSSQTSYTFKLKAVNSKKVESDWSNEESTTTLIDKPAVLTGLRATSKSDKITLFWEASERTQLYMIERNGIVIALDVKEYSYEDQEVSSNTEYTYRVMAVNTTGNSGWSTPLAKKTLGDLPATPSITAVSGCSISATITWTSLETVTGYDIEVDGSFFNVGQNTSYVNNGITPGSYHVYRVRARNTYGKSDWSEAVTYHATPVVPNTPVDVTFSTSATQIRISWSGVQEADSYDVEIDSNVYKNILASEYLYILTGTDLSGSEHTIRVRAVNEGGASEWSGAIIATLTDGEGSLPVITVPNIPAIISSVSGSSILYIAWDRVDGATWYQLEADNSIVYTGTNISYIHTALTENSQHLYRVRAGNSSGVSDWSSLVSLTTGSTNRTTPENINYCRVSDSVIAIIWDKAANINSYRIEINGELSDDIINDSFVEIAITPGEQYTIRIASVIESGAETQLDWSDEMEFRAPSGLPDVPEVESITAAADTVTILWKEVIGAYGYEIDINGAKTDVNNVLSYVITNLAPSTSYKVKIRAYNESGEGNWSEGKTIMTNEGKPGVPINITGESTSIVSAATGCAIKIQWSATDGAVSYEVEDSNGTQYTSETNSIVIDGLEPGVRYYFKVRALTDSGDGEWSSRISFVPEVVAPTNVTVALVDGVVRISWDKVGGADYYEIELSGVTYTTSSGTSIDLDNSLFYLQRTIRVRACYGTQKSEWSKKASYQQTLPVTIEVSEGEEISVVLPFKNTDISNYQLTLTYNADELELLDACEITPTLETSSTYLSDLRTYIVISQKDGMVSITFIIEEASGNNWAGIASSIKFKSKITGTVSLRYGVTKK